MTHSGFMMQYWMKNIKKGQVMDLKELTDAELMTLLYEYKNEIIDPRMYKKLLDELNRRNKE